MSSADVSSDPGPTSLFHTDQFSFPLPATHRFPLAKYAALRRRIEASDWADLVGLHVPPAVTDDEILLAHTPDYLERLKAGTIGREMEKRIGLPWSPELVERSRRSSGATVAACRAALRTGFSANLAGGTHHAYADRGEGYCLLNDSVIAARVLQREGSVRRVAIIDCDVHQGNGTASLVADDPSIYAFSIHSERNYPFVKESSDLDVGLPDGTGDDAYLSALRQSLERVSREFSPDLVLYLAGADPFEGDRLGRLALTKAGLSERDAIVYDWCEPGGWPVAATMAGGYSPDIDDIVDIQEATIRRGVLWNRARPYRRAD